ncbi:MAG: hypothetical protein MJY41_00065 [Bacteroidales bacterium]|nr:hypothetical protein [Bacteroidales bacterium]
MYLSNPMKLLTLILSGILFAAAPQQDARTFWDRVLDKYEALCEACLNHRSTREINTMTKDFNDLLKSPVGKMDEEQTERFVNIQNRYKGIISLAKAPVDRAETGNLVKVDTVRRVEHIQVVDTAFIKEVLGQVEILQTSINKDTIIHLIQYKKEMPEPVVAKEEKAPVVPVPVPPADKISYFILASAGITPDISYGAMVGTLSGRWGGYVKFRSNYSFKTKEYGCNSRGETSGGIIWTNGKSSFSRLAASVGASFSATPWLIAYAGAGYGIADMLWQDYSGRWARVTDASYTGVLLDLGAAVHLGSLALSVGVNNTGLRYFDLELGIGVIF